MITPLPIDTKKLNPREGALLHVLFALCFLDRPATKTEIGEVFSLSDETTARAINRLEDPDLQLVQKVKRGRGGHFTYQLSASGKQFVLPIQLNLPPAQPGPNPPLPTAPARLSPVQSELNSALPTRPARLTPIQSESNPALPLAPSHLTPIQSELNSTLPTPPARLTPVQSESNPTGPTTPAYLTPIQSESNLNPAAPGNFDSDSSGVKTKTDLHPSPPTPVQSESAIPPLAVAGTLTPVQPEINLPSGETAELDSASAGVKPENWAVSQNQSQLIKELNSLAFKSELHQKYYQLLRAGKVYRNIAPGLAEKIVAHCGGDYVADLLAHLTWAFSECANTHSEKARGRTPEGEQIGVYIKAVATRFEAGPIGYFQPATLTFEQALANAQQGQFLAQAEDLALEVESELESEAELVEPPAPKVQPPKADPLWQAALRQLQMEMSKPTFDRWLRDAVGELVGETFLVQVCNSYAKDWLENRLLNTLRRILSNLTHNDQLVVQIVARA